MDGHILCALCALCALFEDNERFPLFLATFEERMRSGLRSLRSDVNPTQDIVAQKSDTLDIVADGNP